MISFVALTLPQSKCPRASIPHFSIHVLFQLGADGRPREPVILSEMSATLLIAVEQEVLDVCSSNRRLRIWPDDFRLDGHLPGTVPASLRDGETVVVATACLFGAEGEDGINGGRSASG